MALFYESVLSSVSIPTVILLSILFILALRFFKSNNNLPPGPRGWPIIGSAPHIDKESYLTFDEWTKKYGDIFTVQLGWNNAVFLNSIDIVKSALKDKGDKFIDRPILPLIELGFTIPGGIVFINGDDWAERRRWAHSVIRDFAQTNKTVATCNKQSLEKYINIEADYLCQEIDKHGDSFNLSHLINNAVSNMICTISFGDRFEYSDPKFKELMEGIRYLFNHSGFFSPVNVIPMLYHTPLYNRFRDIISSIKAFIEDIIRHHEETFDPADVRDLIDAYIVESQKDGVNLTLFSKDTFWRTIFDLFSGGTDTTSSTILFIVLYFVNYPDVQKKVQMEVDEILGQEKKPTWNDRHSMPYLEAAIMEVQRLCNVAPLFARHTREDVEINGYTIPADTTVLTNLFTIHRHPDHWERPLNFEPERFLMDDLKTLKKQEAFVPFGLGKRVCIGEIMARMQLFLFTANLMQRFTFKVPEGKPTPSVDDCVPGLTRSPKPFEIQAIRR